ncbi:MAG: primase protein [Candidatus Pacebacteria bacterium GW2011_GWB1_47_8]|nr:MAG: primase protein [Candidatus Pacebacteria bacterium GW2011_GWA1_46_10]KKU84284.1 MAG: primase protein [Candidatus Pacebacteria bacterium GW2011_GWB1_47_8]
MSQIQQIKDATDIVQLVGERIKLIRSGGSYKALCPFHSEKTPSFFVSEQLQRYRCFGCDETGDVLDFLQKYDGMTFAEALQYLSERTGIKLQEFQRSPEDDLRERLLEVLHLAKEYYHYLLVSHQVGKKARAYLKDRKISTASIELFQLGYAPPGWDGLIKYLHQKKKYSLEDIQKTGLILRGAGGKYYDRFRGRLMFPLKDHRGRVVGFSGRLLEADPKEAKYINTPETMVYHKSQLLYGLKELFAEIKKKEEVIVVEGEFDVISSAQAHINQIVAIKGSALTREQVKLLARSVKKIILSLDADEAGAAAMRRAIEVVGDTDMELRVIDLSSLEKGQKDVDELVRTNPEEWRKLAETSVSVYEFLLNLSLRHHDPTTPEGKRAIVKAVGPIFGQIPHAVERDFYLKKLAETLAVSLDVLMQDVERISRGAAANRPAAETAPAEEISGGRREKLEKYALFLLFSVKEFAQKLAVLQEIPLKSTGFLQILEAFAAKKPQDKADLRILTAGLGEDLKQILFDAVYAPQFQNMQKTFQPEKEWSQTLSALKKEIAREKIEVLQAAIASLEQKAKRTEKEETALSGLLRKVVELQRQLH